MNGGGSLPDNPDFSIARKNIQLQGLHVSCGDVLQRLWVGIYTAVHLIPDAVIIDLTWLMFGVFGVGGGVG